MSADPSAGREIESDLTDDFVVRFLVGVPGRGALQIDGLLKPGDLAKPGEALVFRVFPNLTHSRGQVRSLTNFPLFQQN